MLFGKSAKLAEDLIVFVTCLRCNATVAFDHSITLMPGQARLHWKEVHQTELH